MLSQIIDGVDIRAGQVITLDYSLSRCMVCLPDKKWGQLSHAYSFGAGSVTPELTGLDLSLFGP